MCWSPSLHTKALWGTALPVWQLFGHRLLGQCWS